MDIVQNIQIAAAPADVAAVMFDPAREREWMTSVTSTTPRTAGITLAPKSMDERRRGTADRVGNPGFGLSFSARSAPAHHRWTGRFAELRGAALGSGSVAVVRAASEIDLFGFDLQRLKTLVEGGPAA